LSWLPTHEPASLHRKPVTIKTLAYFGSAARHHGLFSMQPAYNRLCIKTVHIRRQ